MTTLTDEELVRRCKMELPGNTQSYELLMQRYMNRVYGLVYRVVLNKEEAEDITQEVFMKVYNHIKKFEQQASFSSWLYRVATNSALDALDKMKRRPQSATFTKSNQPARNEEETDPPYFQSPSKAGPEERVIQAELRECIRRVLEKLDREQAQVLIMRDFDDLSYDEIAKALEASLSAIKMRIHRARLAFQKIFNQFCGSIYLNFSAPSGSHPKDQA